MTKTQPEQGGGEALEAALEEIINELSRLRLRVDRLNLPFSVAQHDLANHLTLASVAALQLRFNPGDDDIIAEDE